MLLQALINRGMIGEVSNYNNIDKILDNESIPICIELEPTQKKGLHVGNLLPIMFLSYLQLLKQKPIILIEVGKNMIHNQSNITTGERVLSQEEIIENTNLLKTQLQKFFEFEGPCKAIIVEDYDWLNKINVVDWLKDVGDYFSVNYLLKKSSDKDKEIRENEDLTYNELSCIALQAYDFLYLFDTYGCIIQVGSNEQWENIIAGIDLIKKIRHKEVYGLTLPPLVTYSGNSLIDSQGREVWLDPELTSPHEFYQFWLNTNDRDIERFLKIFTEISLEEIRDIISLHSKQPDRKIAQKKLAETITEKIHGTTFIK